MTSSPLTGPQLRSGQNPTPRPRLIIFRTTAGLSLSNMTSGSNPLLAHSSSQMERKRLDPARLMKRASASSSSVMVSPCGLDAGMAMQTRSAKSAREFVTWVTPLSPSVARIVSMMRHPC